ncbi:putative E3 ubiquitin-protein ligase RING1a [Cocos nucifera]|uniref:Putative E3 ubiquitin-protein ligase RING1a n=1 Tax=Cocos nucifera TaxID=13894 RepID=A0A8K0IVF3_COCNU|nr:putative E3 ubiquitin-protein ligase RING1a [Cocos nucifera]
MPAQKRPLPPPSDHLGVPADSSPLPLPRPSQQQQQLPQGDGEQPPQPILPPELPQEEDGGKDDNLSLSPSVFFVSATARSHRLSVSCHLWLLSQDSDGEGGSQYSADAADKEDYYLFRNNECPACRTHCASRRSLRDDPNYDTLIAALYPDIDKYEEEELDFNEEEKARNKKIQASIAETFRRQSEALCRKRSAKATTEVFARKLRGHFRAHGQNSYLRGRGRSAGQDSALACSDDDNEEEVNGNDGGKDSSSAEEHSSDVRQKRCKRRGMPRSSPARTAGNVNGEENDDLEVNKENIRTSPLRAGEMLAWGKNGTRSQTRHGNTSGSNGRLVKFGRMAKFADHIRKLDEYDAEFIALQTSVQAEEVEIYVRKPKVGSLAINSCPTVNTTKSDPSEGQQIVEAQGSLAKLHASFPAKRGDLGEAQSSTPQLQVIIPSAAFGGTIISFVLCPAELVKCRMQVQGKDAATYVKYGGPLDCAIKTMESEGVRGIFRGGLTTLLRESIGNAVFFSTYEFSRYYMNKQLNSPSSTRSHRSKLLTDAGIGIVSGGLSGIAFWSAVLPLDVAKTIIQTAPDTNSSRNPFCTLNSVYRRVGLRGCYAGLGPTLVRAFPANAAAIVTWELTAKFLGVKRL